MQASRIKDDPQTTVLVEEFINVMKMFQVVRPRYCCGETLCGTGVYQLPQ
jgi:hypothetical protein